VSIADLAPARKAAAATVTGIAGSDRGETLTCVFAVRGGGEALAASASASACAGYSDAAGAPYLLPLGESGSGLWAVAQDVPAARYAEQALRERLADHTELEAMARMHHEAVSSSAAVGPVVPLPLATLFTDRDRARETLSQQVTRFRAVLDRVRGREEWAVKVYANAAANAEAAAAAAANEGASGTAKATRTTGRVSGSAYLDRVRSRQRDRQARQDAALACAARVDDAIRALAVDAVRRRPHGPDITGRHRPQILNAAYLLDVDRTDEFNAAIASIKAGEAGEAERAPIEIEVSGPWVPYSFVESGGSA